MYPTREGDQDFPIALTKPLGDCDGNVYASNARTSLRKKN